MLSLYEWTARSTNAIKQCIRTVVRNGKGLRTNASASISLNGPIDERSASQLFCSPFDLMSHPWDYEVYINWAGSLIAIMMKGWFMFTRLEEGIAGFRHVEKLSRKRKEAD